MAVTFEKDLKMCVDKDNETDEFLNEQINDNEDDKTYDLNGSRRTIQTETVSEEVRLRINDRERQRMHQLNKAMDNLKHVLPYSRSVNKLSKLSTLQLARKHILSLQRSHQELQQLKQQLITEQSRQHLQRTVQQRQPLQRTPDLHHTVYQHFPIYLDRQCVNGSSLPKVEQQPNIKLPLQDITNSRNGQNGGKREPLKFSIAAILSDSAPMHSPSPLYHYRM